MSEPELFENEELTNDPALFEPGEDPGPFHRLFSSYAPTPLVEAPELATELGVARVLVKDESSRLGLPSFKMLGASFASYRALLDRFGDELSLSNFSSIEELRELLSSKGPLNLAAATDGNHGRAVARMAKLCGLGAKIYVPEGTAEARIEAISSEGARVEVVAGSYDDAIARSATDASLSCLVVSDTSWPGYTKVPGYVIDGYSTIFGELDEQLSELGARPDAVVTPIGVGALATAVVRAYRRAGARSRPSIIGVEPRTAACLMSSVRAGEMVEAPGPHRSIMAGLNCGLPSEIAFPICSAGIGLFVAIDDEPVRQAMRRLSSAGVVSGETGAAALAGASELVGADRALAARHGIGEGATVLLLSTEGATDPAAYEAIVG